MLLRGVLHRRGEHHHQPATDMLSWAGNGLDDTEREDEPIAGEVCLGPTHFPLWVKAARVAEKKKRLSK